MLKRTTGRFGAALAAATLAVFGIVGLTPNTAFAAGNQSGYCYDYNNPMYPGLMCTTSPAVQANATGHYIHVSTDGAETAHYWLTIRDTSNFASIYSVEEWGNVNFWLPRVYSTYVATMQFMSGDTGQGVDLWVANY